MRRTVLLFVAALACATPRGPTGEQSEPAGAREQAIAGLSAYVLRNDATTGARRLERALQTDRNDPWARFGSALLARRRLDEAAEVAHLVGLVEGAPGHPLVPLAARRLGELAELAPPLARSVEGGLAPVQARLRGQAAARVRGTRAAALSTIGESGRAAALRAEYGVVPAWTVAGPFGGLPALDFDEPLPPEQGPIPETVPAPNGLPPTPTRVVPCTEGALSLAGEPPGGDVFYLAVDVTVSRGGDYVLTVGGTTSLRAFLDGAPMIERRAYAEFLPLVQSVSATLKPGVRRLMLKIGRDGGPAHVVASLARVDGAVSDLRFTPAGVGAPAPPVVRARPPRPVNQAVDLVALLERESPSEIARLAVAADIAEPDRELAKRLVDEALDRAPASAPLLRLSAVLRKDDPTISDKIARGRADAALGRVLSADPGDALARLLRADLARSADRLDDALALLENLSEEAASRPRALVARAHLARARGLSDRAERFAEEARRTGGDCAAIELLLESAIRRDAVARRDELTAALGLCPNGRERLAEDRRRRGDLPGALAIVKETVREAPARIDARLSLAALLEATGDPRGAAAEMMELSRIWPRDARIEKRRAEHLDSAGDGAGARAARERALLLDGSDLALRRAIAGLEGKEPLADVDEDGLATIASYRASNPSFATSSVMVLDFGALEVHRGGALTERIHTIVEARDQKAVERVGEVPVPDGAEMIIARTVKRDGRILHAQDPIGEKHTLSLQNLEPGDFAEWAWLRATPSRGSALPGYSGDLFLFRGDMPLWRSIYTASAPSDLGLEADARFVAVPPLGTEKDRVTLRVVREAVPPFIPEPNSPADSEYAPSIQVGAGVSHLEFARVMANALTESLRPSLELRRLAEQIASEVTARDGRAEALARATYRKVNELVLGHGGSAAESAGSILSRGQGSRTILLKSLLDALGLHARLAMVRDFSRNPGPYRFPRPEFYRHLIVRFEADGKVFWLDPTARSAPFGVLPGPLRGVEALVLPIPGERVKVVRTPEGETERRIARLHVELDAAGGATLEGTDDYRGYDAAALRESLEQLDEQARRQAIEQALARSFDSPVLTSFRVDGERTLEGPLVLEWKARVSRWARPVGSTIIAEAPLFPALLGVRFVQRSSRESPLLIQNEERNGMELTVTPPTGFIAVPARQVSIASDYGRYTRSEQVEGARLVRKDTYDLRRGRVTPADYPSFAGFARSIDSAQAVPMVFRRATPGVTSPPVAGP